MPLPRSFKAISLFGRETGHFPVPANFPLAVARSGGPGRRAATARKRLALEGREPGGRLVRCGTGVRLLVNFCSLVVGLGMVGGDLHAQPLPEVGAPRASVRAELTRQIDTAVAEAARRFDLPEAWIRAVMRAESGLDSRAVSRAGAMGLMQLMPPTWATLRATLGLGDDPFDVRDNVVAGAAYLRELIDRFGVPGFLAAYNAGPGRYAEYLATGRPLPPETRAYVAVVVSRIGFSAQSGPKPVVRLASIRWTQAPLFVGGQQSPIAGNAAGEARVANAHPAAVNSPPKATPDPLFAVQLGQRVRP